MKRTVLDMALFGGSPLFKDIRPIGQLACGKTEVFFQYMDEIYACRRLTNNGPLVRRLEERLMKLHNVEHCISFCSASLALVILMHSFHADNRSEVIIPSFAYPGLPHLVRWAGFDPRFCDVDSTTHTLCPKATGKALSGKTALILGVHQANSPCRIEEMQSVADSMGVPLCFDSVHGIGCTYKGTTIGSFGEAEVFSLHATKLVNGFEGGYVTTNNPALADQLRRGRNFGFDALGQVGAGQSLNAKLNELHAALALTTLDSLAETIRANRARYECYCRCFQTIEGTSILPYLDLEKNNFEFVFLEVDETWPLQRDTLVEILRSENALARPYMSPATHLSEHCPSKLVGCWLPETELLSNRLIQMPVGEKVSFEDIERLADFFRFLQREGDSIRARLALTPHSGTVV